MSALARTLDHLRARAGDPPADDDLLARFITSRDGDAFAELVRRYGPLVRGVARRRLADPHEADDVVQATFLALARQAARLGRGRPLAGWLFTVAHRLAGKARARAARRPGSPPADVPTAPDLLAALDDELARLPDRYRLPLVLCALEGLSRDEATARLGWTLGALRGRLGRGRELLRKRLAARGLTVPAVLAGGLLVSPAEALPPGLVQTITRVAVAAPATGGTGRTLLVLLAATFGIGTAVWTWQPTPSGLVDRQNPGEAPAAAPPGPPPADAGRDTFTFAGRVLGPDGRPLAGARVSFSGLRPGVIEFRDRTTSSPDGTFRFTVRRTEIDEAAVPRHRLPLGREFMVGARADGCGSTSVWPRDPGLWERLTLRLPAEEIVRGRVVDGNGKPVPGVRVRAYLRSGRADKDFKPLPYDTPDDPGHQYLQEVPFDESRGDPVTAADGRVTVRGLSRDWLYGLTISGPTVLSAEALLAARPEPPVINGGRPPIPGRPAPLAYGSTFTHVTAPCKPITGVVREKASGRPLAGVEIIRAYTGNTLDPRIATTTDKDGRYTLTGLPHGSHRLKAYPPQNTPYVTTEVIAAANQNGFEPLTLDIELERQPAVTGRLTDQATGKPLRGWIEYRPLAVNPNLAANRALAERRLGNQPPSTRTDADGRFTLPVLAGSGVVLVRADADYRPAALTAADRRPGVLLPDDTELVDCRPFPAWPAEFHAYRVVNVPADGTAAVAVALPPAVSRPLVVEYPDGRATDTNVLGLSPSPAMTREARFYAGWSVVGGLAPDEGRRLFLSTHDGKLAAATTVWGDEPGPAVVRLKPTGTVSGRVVDAAGQPVKGASFKLFFDDGPGRPGVFIHKGFIARKVPAAEAKRDE